ncbi:MAG: Ig-like domain-containing protein [Gemmatimonadales bacterium]
MRPVSVNPWRATVLLAGVAAACSSSEPELPLPPPPGGLPPNTGVRSVTVIPDNIVVEVGDTVRFTASGSGGLTLVSCQWQSSNAGVATVDSTALGRAVGAGTAAIRATCAIAANGSASGAATLNVR